MGNGLFWQILADCKHASIGAVVQLEFKPNLGIKKDSSLRSE
jgi:hypothetical protein